MYSTLLAFHSLLRWMVFTFLVYAIYRAFTGYTRNRQFSKTDNGFRHWTATVAHIQLMIGIILYTQSPIVSYYWSSVDSGFHSKEFTFFGIIHMALMLVAIVVITIGSALAKRKPTDQEKFKAMLVWFVIAFILIMIAIPWPFSPLSNRPFFRTF